MSSNAQLYQWGANYYGQLGNGENGIINGVNDVPTLLKGKPSITKRVKYK